METMKQQLYEKKELPESFYPKDAIVFKVSTMSDNYFDTDSTFEECLTAVKAGITFEILCKYNNKYSIYRANEIYNYNPLDKEPVYDESICIVINESSNYGNIYKQYFIYKNDDSKTVSTKDIIRNDQILIIIDLTSVIRALIDNNLMKANEGLVKLFPGLDYTNITWQLGRINTIGQYHNAKVYIDSPGGSVTFTWFEGNGLSISNKMNILSFTGSRAGGILYFKHDIIDLGTSNGLYRVSPMNIEPITNPKIWIGTAVQYAAIAEKDPNTTYIVKSE